MQTRKKITVGSCQLVPSCGWMHVVARTWGAAPYTAILSGFVVLVPSTCGHAGPCNQYPKLLHGGITTCSKTP
jgi:hypothetical protein